ncbi:MAG: Phosphoglycerol transferase, alkaline phosphatase superfamily [Firmicutes bacterium]|nr:Phosphoglycerol transferase, alkaline phosphatase superfamily [Bacillota bacterium]
MNNKFKVAINWKSKKNIPIYLLSVYFVYVMIHYTLHRKEDMPALGMAGIIAIWIVLTFLYMTETTTGREFIDRYGRWFRGILLLLQPAIAFVMIEVMVSNYNKEMFQKYSFYNIVWYYIIIFLLYALLRNSRLTILLSNALIYLVGMINYLVYLFRGNPIIPSDLLAWQTGVSVASNYQVSFTLGFILATLMMYAIFVVGVKLGNGQVKFSVLNRILGFAAYSATATVIFLMFFRTDLIETKIRVIDFFAPKYTYCAYGTAFGFVANVEAMETEPPEGYSVDAVDIALSKAEENKSLATEAQTKPNIIAIMNEAFSDLSMVGDYKSNKSYLPFINSLDENSTKGIMFSSVFGGATSDTEYEFLTGNSMAVMPQNSVPYQQFVTESTDSLAATLKAQGYYNIAIHPYEPSGYKRDLVYPLLGFDEFLSKKDFKNPELIRSFISDRESYKKIIEQYETKGDKPLFIFNVTMQNHGGYSGEQLFDEENSVRLTELPRYPKVEQYLSLLRKSDQAFEELVDYFSKQKEPTIILMFGDHQPVVYSDFQNQIESESTEINQRRYMVPFILWANYDINEDDVDKISANYLSSYLLKTAGLPGTAYNNYLLQLHQELPVMNAHFYITKDQECYPYSAITPYTPLIQEYKEVGYNDALDKDNKLWKYFEIKE